jgi:hypothetical protein
MLFRWCAGVVEAWLGLERWVRAPFRRRFGVRDAWRALPGDLLGLMVMRGCGIAAPTRVVEVGDVSAVLVEDRRVELWLGSQLMPVTAQTLGRYVFSRDPVGDELLAHECEHIRQWRRFGPFYLALYFGSSALVSLRGGRPYWDNPFEAAARRRADRDVAARRSSVA